MKKLFISILVLTLIIGTIFTIKNINTKEESVVENTSIAYRVETNQNLIVEEYPIENQDIITTEEDFTTYIEEVNNDINELTTKEELSILDKETLKNTFITLTDFIFYNGKIKGKTFNDLTTTTKEKVIDIYEKIDSKIESVYPGYKEKIKETSQKAYTNIKDKLLEVKSNITNVYKQEIGEERFNNQVETFNESKENMKESFEPVIDQIIEESKKVYENTKDKLNNYYQAWKEENK